MMNFIFGWINFGILIFIGRYLYKKYMHTPINRMILDEETKLKSLKSEACSLENHVKEVSLDIIMQDKKAKQTLDKVKDWKLQFNNNLESQTKNIAEVQNKIDFKNSIKSENLSQRISQKNTLSKIANNTQNILKEKFNNPKNAQNYLESAIKKLEVGAKS